MVKIIDVLGRELLDSRGKPTLEADVILDNGQIGRAIVPSGASTGKYEAVELRDGGRRYHGYGVLNSIKFIKEIIAPALKGCDVNKQANIDQRLCQLDGSQNKAQLGANTLLAVSLAVARAGAKAVNLPLYQYIGGSYAHILPVPLMNILNGGVHADNKLDFQEFMIMPVGAPSFREALRFGAEIFYVLKDQLKSQGHNVNVGDEGGFAPALKSADEALDLLMAAIERAGFSPGRDIVLALDCAASEFLQEDGSYYYKGENIKRDKDEHLAYIIKLCEAYPIYSLEDAMAEDDWEGWANLTAALGKKCQLVGDDLFVTNPERLEKGIRHNIANAILIKVNQIGTLSEAMEAVTMAQKAGYGCVMSHRSGETEDSIIADLAVATHCGQIKTGSLSRSDRLAKYNQLLRIEEELGTIASYPRDSIFSFSKV